MAILRSEKYEARRSFAWELSEEYEEWIRNKRIRDTTEKRRIQRARLIAKEKLLRIRSSEIESARRSSHRRRADTTTTSERTGRTKSDKGIREGTATAYTCPREREGTTGTSYWARKVAWKKGWLHEVGGHCFMNIERRHFESWTASRAADSVTLFKSSLLGYVQPAAATHYYIGACATPIVRLQLIRPE